MKNCETKDAFLQEGFSLTSSAPKPKAKRRKTADAFEVHGGRVIRSAGRKDRHSKVCTATGLTKDRRVRLSPQTAIHFYDVQDRLGCDRPSKAIDWLMKEAKAAIDALDKPPLAPNTKNQQTLKTESGINPNFENLNNGFFSEVAAPPLYLAEFQSAPSASPPEIFDANLEIARLQRIFSWNYNFPVGSPPPDLSHGHMFSDREPLQSRVSPGNSFWNEDLLNFNGAATSKEDNLDNSKSYSTASFLHYED